MRASPGWRSHRGWRSGVSQKISLDHQQDIAVLDDIAGIDKDLGDLAVNRAVDGVFHLHRLKDKEGIPFLHRSATAYREPGAPCPAYCS